MIRWFSLHPLAANILMAMILIIGFFAIQTVKTEVIPSVQVDWLQVNVPFAGMSSQGIEQPAVERLERQIQSLAGVDEVNTIIKQGLLQFQVVLSAKNAKVLADTKSDVRALLDTLERPSGAGAPSVFQVRIEPAVAALSLSGPYSYADLEARAQAFRRQLETMSELGEINLYFPPDRTTVIQLNPIAMAAVGVTAMDVAQALRNSRKVFDVGEVQENGRLYRLGNADEQNLSSIGNPVIRRLPNGQVIRLDEVANVHLPAFEVGHRLDGQPAVLLTVKSGPGKGLVAVSERLQAFIESSKSSLPDELTLSLWQDTSKYYKARIDVLIENGFFAFILLFVILTVFLNWRLSLWVSLGLPVAFFGGFLVLWSGGFSLNMVSLFAFILVLGVMVDDAIIVGDSVYEAQHNWLANRGVGPVNAREAHDLDNRLVASVQQVAKPVVIAAMTTIMMFVPLLFLPGDEGRMLRGIPVVVIGCLLFSLVESLLILPAHLRVAPQQLMARQTASSVIPQGVFNRLQNSSPGRFFFKAVNWNNDHPWFSQVLFISAFIFLFVLLASGRVDYSFFAKIEGDMAVAQVTMVEGAQQEDLDRVLDTLESAALALQRDNYQNPQAPKIKHVLRKATVSSASPLIGQVALEMSTLGTREIAADAVADQWRRKLGPLEFVEVLTVQTSLNPARDEVSFYINAYDRTALEEAAFALKHWLEQQRGVQTVVLDGADLKPQVVFDLNPYGQSLGLSNQDIAQQIRTLTMDDSIIDLQLASGSSPVYLRLSSSGTLDSFADLGRLPIVSPQGQFLTLSDVAQLQQTKIPMTLTRVNGIPSVKVIIATAPGVEGAVWQGSKWRKQVQEVVTEKFPKVELSNGLFQQEQVDIEQYLKFSFLLALVSMYALMAVLLKSYWLPLSVLYAVPFGLVGAVLGHWVVGISFTLYSLIGAFAVSGIVVNDNLVLLDRFQAIRAAQAELRIQDVITLVVQQRVRAVLLTTLTTVLGMMPLILESSIQSQFLKPMAVSLAFGIGTATFVTLFLVPATLALFSKRANQVDVYSA